MVENDAPLEANKPVTVTESWLNVDRDGDGIAELKAYNNCWRLYKCMKKTLIAYH